MTGSALVHIALMGAQGSGKGTQASRLTARYGLEHLSTGELFRAAIASASPLGRQIKAIYDRGDLIPDDLTLDLVAQRLDEIAAARAGDATITGALFDGFPRTDVQAAGFDRLLERRGERLAGVVQVVVPRETLVRRLAGRRVCPKDGRTYHVEFDPPARPDHCDLCGTPLIQREDDTPEAIKRRLDTYFSQTAPLVDYYRARDLLREVNGDQQVERVTAEIEAALASFGLAPVAAAVDRA